MITFPTKLRTRTRLSWIENLLNVQKSKRASSIKRHWSSSTSNCMYICCQMSVVTKVWWMVCHHVNWIHTIQGWCNVWDAALVQGWPIIHAFDPNHAKTWGQFYQDQDQFILQMYIHVSHQLHLIKIWFKYHCEQFSKTNPCKWPYLYHLHVLTENRILNQNLD